MVSFIYDDNYVTVTSFCVCVFLLEYESFAFLIVDIRFYFIFNYDGFYD